MKITFECSAIDELKEAAEILTSYFKEKHVGLLLDNEIQNCMH
jgi:hypothetical protein